LIMSATCLFQSAGVIDLGSLLSLDRLGIVPPPPGGPHEVRDPGEERVRFPPSAPEAYLPRKLIIRLRIGCVSTEKLSFPVTFCQM
jgi:hypothetical protein